MEGARVLIVEDELIIGMHIKSMLTSRGYRVIGPVPTGEEALSLAEAEAPDILLLDIILDGKMDGTQTYRAIKNILDIPAVYLTAHSDAATLEKARETSPYGYVLKPINEKELYSIIELALFKHETEKKLKESEAKFRGLFEMSFQMVGMLTTDGLIMEVNRSALESIESAIEDVRSLPLWKSPWFDGLREEREKVKNMLARAREGEFVRDEIRHVSPKQVISVFDFSLKPVTDDHGRAIFIIAEGRDITGLKEAQEKINLQNQELQAINEELNATIEELEATNEEFEAQNEELIAAENELRRSEEKYRSLVENINEVIYTIDRDGVITYLSPGIGKLTGFRPEEMTGRPFTSFVHPDDLDDLIGDFGDLARGAVRPSEYRIQTNTGDYRWVMTTSRPFMKAGAFNGATGVLTDIHEMKLAREALRESEERLRAIGDNLPGGMVYRLTVTPEGERKFTYVSEGVRALHGYSPEEIMKDGSLLYKQMIEEDYRRISEEERRVKLGSGVFDSEARFRLPSGEVRCYRLISQPRRAESGEIIADGFEFDITEQKHAEEKLIKKNEEIEAANEELQAAIEEMEATNEALALSGRELEEKTRELDNYFNYALDLFCIADTDGHFRRLNREWEKVLGYTINELEGAGFLDFVHPDDIDATLAAVSDLDSQKEVLSFTNRYRRRDGEYRWIEWRSFPMGKLIYAAARDITVHIQNEEALKEKERSMKLILDSISEMFLFQDIDHRIIWTNRAAAESLNVRIEDMAGKKCYEFWGQSEDECGFCPFRVVRETGLPHEAETTTPDGRSWNIRGYPVRDENGIITNYVEVTSEITESKRARDELKKSEEKYRRIVDTAMEGIWQVDREFRIIFVNRRMTQMLGHEESELLGRPTGDFLLEDDMAVQKIKWENQKKGVAESYERRFRRKDGTILWTITSASPIFDKDGVFAGSYSMMTDISGRKTAEEEKDRIQSQLVQAQKMEAIGTLAGGIAHDFNNMLGGIMGSLNLLELLLAREEIQQRESIDKYIETSLGSCRRAADMTRQLLALSKKGDLRLMPTDINMSLKNVMEIAKSSFPKSITLDFTIAETPLRIMADPTQIEQVLLNLCVNASHAMTLMREEGSREGGTLTVRADTVNGGTVPRPQHPDARAGGEYVGVAISDTGVGMDEETLERVFDPFFTTKKKQQGTGLGLSMAYGIVRQHGGFITVRSTPGVGSVFTVYLPALNKAAADAVSERKNGNIVKGTGRVLIFDDEKAILRIARGILGQCGYETVTARSGPEGLEIYRSEHRTIDGILLDLSMPGMSGLEVYERLREINPTVRVLLSSGYMEEDTLKKAGERGIQGFIHKPYTAEELSEKMSELLR